MLLGADLLVLLTDTGGLYIVGSAPRDRRRS